MLWRYKVVGIRRKDKRDVELTRTFSYYKAMHQLGLVHSVYDSVYSEVRVEFPFWSLK